MRAQMPEMPGIFPDAAVAMRLAIPISMPPMRAW